MTSIIDLAKARQVAASGTKEGTATEQTFDPSAAPSEHAFKSIELLQYARHDGSTVKPVNGWFDPKDEEDFSLLTHYAAQYNLVEAPASSAKE